MPFHRTRFLGLAILTILPPVILAQDAPAPRLAEPDDAAQKQAEKTIRDLLKEDYSKRAPADQQALAKKLLRLGDEAKEDAVARYVLLQEAREISAKVGDVETALSAVAETVKRYEVDGIALKAKTLAAMVPGSKSSEAAGALADACLEVIDEAVEEEKFDVARSLVSKAEAAARAARDASRAAEAQRKGREIETLQRESQKAKEAAKILESNPADPDASLVRGRYLLLKGNFEKALPLLSKGADPLLREAADKELAGPSKPEDLASAADAWWEAAEKESGALKDALQGHAMKGYDRALEGLSGIRKIQIEKRMQGSLEAAKRPGTVVANRIVLWNMHNGIHNDRGTTKINVMLLNGERELFAARGLKMPWESNKDLSLDVAIPHVPFTSVRVEVTEFVGSGGGLAEVQVMQGRTNIALGRTVKSSGKHPAAVHPGAETLTDGITTSADYCKGYWALPNSTPGWAEVLFIDTPGKRRTSK